jgi:hypothetical protein
MDYKPDEQGLLCLLGLEQRTADKEQTPRLCLDALKSALCKIRFPVTSNLRYIYGVLNVDKIKN